MLNNANNSYLVKYFLLSADLDLTSSTELNAPHSFIGHFDGQNHIITINITGSDVRPFSEMFIANQQKMPFLGG